MCDLAARKYDYNGYYEREFDGNAVRERNRKLERQREQRRREDSRITARENRAQASRLRKLEKSLGINLFSCIMLVGAAVVMFTLCFKMIQLGNEIDTIDRNVVTTQNEVNDIRVSNNSAYQEINSTVDLKEVYKTATQELGMVFASDNQIITYEDNEAAYVRQYKNIPENPKNNFFDDIVGYLSN